MAAMTRGTGFLRRLYRGDTRIEFIGNRKRWYLASAVIILVCLISIIFRGFNFGIDFKGGDQFQLPVKPGTTLSQVRESVEGTGVEVSSAQQAGGGAQATYVIKTEKLTDAQVDTAEAALSRTDGVTRSQISFTEVSSSWGSEVTNKAIEALVAFLIAVSAFMALRFRDAKAAGAAILALFHDLILTAGVYSIIGFEVTPGTVVGLLTILGYSLYDTVVVFDRVDEDTKGLLGGTRQTYAEAANLAVNQTLMRSINTSLIGLLPVGGLLFVGAGLLGVGTLQDLALVLFVGMLTGAYSSLFLATPWLVDFKMTDSRFRNQANRVKTKRLADAHRAAAKAGSASGGAAGRQQGADDDPAAVDDDAEPRIDALAGAPRVGAKPTGSKRTPASRSTRPSAGKRRH